MDDKLQRKLDRAMRALLNMNAVPHERPKFTKDDLKRKFVLRLKRNGKPEMKEV
ncbi:MAG: hypothetical protein OXG15_09860 [Gammaproteobacteria bacterium]|nr:hypothetical protein [Gammaproteobacteria bacterium]